MLLRGFDVSCAWNHDSRCSGYARCGDWRNCVGGERDGRLRSLRADPDPQGEVAQSNGNLRQRGSF